MKHIFINLYAISMNEISKSFVESNHITIRFNI